MPFHSKKADKEEVKTIKARRWLKPNSLSLKLLIATWAVSSLATLILTALQLTMDYQKDIDKLQNNFKIIEGSYLGSMAEHLWSYDTRLLEIQLDGLSRLPGVSHLRLISDDRIIYEFGKRNAEQQLHRIFEIYHQNTNEKLGTLEVELDVSSIKNKYLQEAVWIFIRQAAKTMIVVFVLYFLFNHILVVHIAHIADHLKNKNKEELTLNRKVDATEDELDILVKSINTYRRELVEANRQLEKLNAELEKKVEQRTWQLTTKNESLEKAMMQIKRMQATLVAQERLASLGSLTSSVAHEIRNPLNFVLNFSELLGELENPQEIHDISKIILKHSQRIDQIVCSMQILSGDDTDRLEVTDVNELLRRAYHETVSSRMMSSSYIPNKVNYRLTENAKIAVYPKALLRAMSNIIDNSIYALEKRNLIDSSLSSEITLGTAIKDENLEITIRDNGTGIPSIIGEKIFDPFLTTKAAGEGAGLGLTVAFNVAQKHGGTIKYATEPGAWTEFCISLPLKQESST